MINRDTHELQSQQSTACNLSTFDAQNVSIAEINLSINDETRKRFSAHKPRSRLKRRNNIRHHSSRSLTLQLFKYFWFETSRAFRVYGQRFEPSTLRLSREDIFLSVARIINNRIE